MRLHKSPACQHHAAAPDARSQVAAAGARGGTGRAGWLALAVSAAALVLCALMPQYAAAEATPGPESTPGPPGLPNGRVYEQVSPQHDNGNSAGTPTQSGQPSQNGAPPRILAAADGDGALYSATGPLGETDNGYNFFALSLRLSTGWATFGAIPRGNGLQGIYFTKPETLGVSANGEVTIFGTRDTYTEEQSLTEMGPRLYRYTPQTGQVQWIAQPSIADPVRYGKPGQYAVTANAVGASSSLESIYVGYEGTLVAADEQPDPSFGGLSREQVIRERNETLPPGYRNVGFYEWHAGKLQAAGVLPDGHLDPYGAQPATYPQNGGYTRELLGNEVSEDGRTAFFVSPDPACQCGRPPELYARITAPDGSQRTVLVSRDAAVPSSGGAPTPALHGVSEYAKHSGRTGALVSFAWASPDGSHVFFESTDRLTASAPSGGAVKAYDFNLEEEALHYLPGVAEGTSITPLASSRNGSVLAYERSGILNMWHEGTVSEIGPISAGFEAQVNVRRMTPDGAIFAFETKSPFTALKFNNGGGAYTQVYRYEVATGNLSCLSCPHAGTSPNGDAKLSNDVVNAPLTKVLSESRSITEDGSRVFFDTPAPLVPQDSNGVRDVYMWEDGTVYLISTGASPGNSYFGDNSANGNDVFFSTSAPLAEGDTNGGYDVYDARVPRPGDRLPEGAAPCEGAACHNAPSSPQLLRAPASATFSGEGNLTPAKPRIPAKERKLTRRQRLRRALKACQGLHQNNRAKRRACKRRARRRLMPRRQKLRRALKECERLYRHNRHRRRECKRRARKRYGSHAKAASSHRRRHRRREGHAARRTGHRNGTRHRNGRGN